MELPFMAGVGVSEFTLTAVGRATYEADRHRLPCGRPCRNRGERP